MPHTLNTADRISLLYEVTTLRSDALETRIGTALELITRTLSLEVGILSRIEGETYTVQQVYAPNSGLEAGQVFSLGQTYCQLTLEADEVISISHAETSPYAYHPCRTGFGLESYIGAVIMVRGERIGTLNFSSTAPRRIAFTPEDEHLVAMLARWVGVALETQLAEEARAESEARFQNAFDNAAIGMAIVAPDGRLVEVNESFCVMLGYTAAELQQLSFQHITYPEDLATDLNRVNEILAGKRQVYQMEKRYVHRLGHVIWGYLSVSAVRHKDGGVKYLVAQIQDVTKRKESEAQVQRLAYHDALTGLYNRHYFFERVPRELAYARRQGYTSALLYLDLNGFKQVNDTFGHQIGDDLLSGVAHRFKQVFRQGDILARVGGDEFAVFLSGMDQANAERIARRLADSLEAPFLLSGMTCQVGVSIGVLLVGEELDLESLIKTVDAAMYRAKARKTNEPRAVEVVAFDSVQTKLMKTTPVQFN